VSKLVEARAKIISIIGGTNLPSSDIKDNIIKSLGNPNLMQEKYLQNVRYGLSLAVNVLDEMIEQERAER
jgi:hypothetical protein